ncbi:MAG TPA: HAMP domain-containing sensor histidine kinase [Polyangiaceae bacterium]|nr:HAMP domain-containing sensor histidine kinase [Polyangiaceae bacterium]
MAERTRRERLLTFLLLPAIVLSVVVLATVMFRSSFQLEKLREQSVIEATLLLANEKADRLDKRIIEQDNLVRSLVDAGERREFGQKWLEGAAIQTPTVLSVSLVDWDAPERPVIAVASRAKGPENERFRRLLVSFMLRDMKIDAPPLGQLRHLHKTYHGQSYLLSHWLQEDDGRRHLVVVWHDVSRIVHDVFPALYGDDQQSRVNVVDAEGRTVFGPPLGRGGMTLGRPFETTLYKWTLNVSMASTVQLAAAVARRRVLEMVLVGLSSIVVVAGLFVIVVAAARERKLSALKSDFVANVSHELKTPLALVRMFGELLQSGRVENDEKRQQYLTIIVSESERLGALIENVLDFAKVERGKQAYDFVESSVADVVARAVEACRVRAERDRVALDYESEAALPAVELDERAIEIAVINLVDNALKYAPDGQRVTVRVRRAGDKVEIRVSDQGGGIAVDDRKRIFDRFVRGKSAVGKQVRGSGIGLALVKHIAEAHGGGAWVEDNLPRGSTFVITIRAERGQREVEIVPGTAIS